VQRRKERATYRPTGYSKARGSPSARPGGAHRLNAQQHRRLPKGADAETAWLPPEIAVDPKGYVLTGADVRAAGRWELDRDPYLLETSVPGIFACGDVRYSPVKRVASAVGEGSMAIALVHQFLREAVASSA
jgi:NADPH-dependent glutamate synthase beta subunit-like oxidoreductase